MTAESDYFGHDELFATVLNGSPGAYALLYRPESDSAEVELFTGTMSVVERLEDIPDLRRVYSNVEAGSEMLAIIPYRQITERGFECVDDREPLSVMSITATSRLSKNTVIEAIVDSEIELVGGCYDRDDDEYAHTALQIIQDEIGTGAGANFVLKRSYVASIRNYSRAKVFALYRRLLLQSSGTYWVFLVDTGDRVFIGATPERHVSLKSGIATMNPISGTYRYPSTGPSVEGVLEFLADSKEREELFMVVDEELKMMGRVCGEGATLSGPYLKPMAKLAHTEYLISGSTTLPPWRIIRETLFAPTITGSPLENACRVIKKYEPEGRGYYSGVIALFGRDDAGVETLDSSILIRTADINKYGTLRLSTGATLVRDSIPLSEAAETRVKAAGMLGALGSLGGQADALVAGTDHAAGLRQIAQDSRVIRALQSRNDNISDYWQTSPPLRYRPDPMLNGRRVLVLDAEDTFTAMICHQLSSFGLNVSVASTATAFDPEGYDLVVLGPGPGDPNDETDPRVARLQSAARMLLLERKPFLAICLSHQILCRQLGLQVTQKQRPNQGAQRQIDLFGEAALVGFYNAYSATCPSSTVTLPQGIKAYVSRDPVSGEVHAVRGPSFTSFQFHPESILSLHGERLLGDAAKALIS
ncbi:phenazine-specific anthranilate synthase component I [Pseudomonas asturiensis]|uniref:anthranilate synthase n=1 Tax=Pseudomonas asturiensis TaxID=1190415 RepID=A0ABX6HG53_9PSED|nr:chorismate-binding protein [Pseudomonas asturiensis]QHF04576.1 phenazine-specific anthranilate synthase component I [Pseudomonas asturiensis]